MVTPGTAGASTPNEDRAHDTACHPRTPNAQFRSRTEPTLTHGSPPVSGRLHEAITDNLAVLADCNATYLQ